MTNHFVGWFFQLIVFLINFAYFFFVFEMCSRLLQSQSRVVWCWFLCWIYFSLIWIWPKWFFWKFCKKRVFFYSRKKLGSYALCMCVCRLSLCPSLFLLQHKRESERCSRESPSFTLDQSASSIRYHTNKIEIRTNHSHLKCYLQRSYVLLASCWDIMDFLKCASQWE